LGITVGLFVFVLSFMLTPFTSVLASAGVTAGDPEATLDDVTGTGLADDISLPEFIGRIISWVVGILGVVLVALFVYGGVVYATSIGNEDRIEMGKKIMLYAIIGVIIIAVAFAISRYVIQALFTAV
jgi:hypothetical protein